MPWSLKCSYLSENLHSDDNIIRGESQGPFIKPENCDHNIIQYIFKHFSYKIHESYFVPIPQPIKKTVKSAIFEWLKNPQKITVSEPNNNFFWLIAAKFKNNTITLNYQDLLPKLNVLFYLR